HFLTWRTIRGQFVPSFRLVASTGRLVASPWCLVASPRRFASSRRLADGETERGEGRPFLAEPQVGAVAERVLVDVAVQDTPADVPIDGQHLMALALEASEEGLQVLLTVKDGQSLCPRAPVRLQVVLRSVHSETAGADVPERCLHEVEAVPQRSKV